MAIRGALISTQAIWYVPVVYSGGKEETKDIILMIGRQEEACMDVVPLRGGYRPKRLKSRQLFILQGLPKVGPIVAKRLLEYFIKGPIFVLTSVSPLTPTLSPKMGERAG